MAIQLPAAKPSVYLERLRKRVSESDKVFCLMHLGMSEFYASYREYPIRFTWPGTDTEWHEPISLIEVQSVGGLIGGMGVVHSCLSLAFSIDRFLLDLVKTLPMYKTLNDVSWWSPDMVEAVSNVPVMTIPGWDTIKKLYRMREVSFQISSAGPGDEIAFAELLNMLRIVPKFAEEFEIAFREMHPEVVL